MSDSNDFVSSVKLIPYAQDVVYDKLQDLRHLENLCSRLKDPAFVEQAKGQFDSSKVEEAIKRLESVRFTQDSLSVDSPVGAMTLAIVDRDEPKCIKFESQGSPIGINMWIQLLPDGDGASKMRLTVRAELNMFIRKMIESKLAEGVEQLAEMLSKIPYGA
ncbi:MAG TPA: polyketide cyclase [Prevotellaceae bacterium]|jgi:carbon monoxide dehydrogenase subunit G|nr:polyketide cyclase [Prevotellaceae bacterium]